MSTLDASLKLIPHKLGNTPTEAVLATAADMLDEMAQRLGGLQDTPVVARKLRELRGAVVDPREWHKAAS